MTIVIIPIELLFEDLRTSLVNCAARSKTKEQRALENNRRSFSQEILLAESEYLLPTFARLVKQMRYTSELSSNHRQYLSVYEIGVLTFYKNLPSF
jgi:hypothetical protein